MKRTLAFVLVVISIFAAVMVVPARADVTIRFKGEFKPGALIPASVMQQAAKQNPAATGLSETVIRIKGSKMRSKTFSGETLTDLARQEITVIDPPNQRYATVYATDYLAELFSVLPKMPAMPPEARQILQMLKTTFSTRKTGRTDTVMGVSVEENEWTITLDLPLDGLPIPPGMFPPGQPVTLIKLVGQNWTATDDAMRDNAALAELAARRSSGTLSVDPNGLLSGALKNYPGIRDGLAPMLEFKSPGVVMKLHISIYFPVVAQVAPLAAAQGHPLPPGMDADAPAGEVTTEVTDLSAATIDDAVFQVPSDYHPVPLSDILKASMPITPATQTPAANPPSKP